MRKQTKVSLISLGCPKNLVDSEKILGAVAESGAAICSLHEDADVIVVNTCGFIEDAKEEAVDVILQAAKLKETGRCQRLIVTGCLAERYGQLLKKDMPEIDYVIGIGKFDELSSLCMSSDSALNNTHSQPFAKKSQTQSYEVASSSQLECEPPSLRLTPKHYAYLRIADGCDNHCSYCVIGKIRGQLKSRPIEDVLRDAEYLVNDGARELNVIAQDTTSYGTDLYGTPRLSKLIRMLSQINGLHWIRILYTHPAHFTDELIEEIAENDKVCNYIDLPIQHINDEILSRMRRQVTRAQIENLIEKLRLNVHNLAIRTSLIVGFPGETESQFEELLDFMEHTRFERLGAFVYSQEEGTPAAKYGRQIPEKVKCERLEAVMSLQQQIAFDYNEQMLGREMMVLVESEIENYEPSSNSTSAKEYGIDCRWIGRTYADAPEVDGNIYLKAPHSVQDQDNFQNKLTGEFTKAFIIGTDEYDLIGEICS